MNILNVKDSKNKEFWFSHFIILLATVVAVYLAASAGLKAAVSFEVIKSDKDSYYMRTALLSEVEENAKNMDSWAKSYTSGNAGDFWRNPEDYKLDTYVWTAMTQQPSVFEIPSTILTDIRRYYAKANNTLSKMTAKKAAHKEAKALIIESKTLKEKTLEALKLNIKQLEDKLYAYGVLEN